METVSIIIPIKNAERTLVKTLEYLLDVDYPKDRMEIILADGGSTDKTIEIIKSWQGKYPFIKFVEVPNCKTPGIARNAALQAVTGDYILFTDADCIPDKNWIKELLAPFKTDPQIGAVGGEILTYRTDENNMIESYCEQIGFLKVAGRCGLEASGYMPVLSESPRPSEVNGSGSCPFFATANVAFKKEAWVKAGGRFWDQPTGEDVEANIKLLRAGYKLYFNVNALVKHMHRVTLKSLLRQWEGYGYSHPTLVVNHAGKKFEIVVQFLPGSPAYIIPGPKGIIYIGDFHMLHLSGLLYLIGLIAGWAYLVKLFFLAVFVVFMYRFFASSLTLKPKSEFFTWAKLRYLTNLYYIWGAIKGSIDFGSLSIEQSWVGLGGHAKFK